MDIFYEILSFIESKPEILYAGQMQKAVKMSVEKWIWSENINICAVMLETWSPADLKYIY